MTDLVDRLGGVDVLEPVVTDFYERVQRDEDLAPVFEGVDMDVLVRMQQQFLTAAFQAEPAWSADTVREIHADRNITPHHFSRFVEHFLLTLEDHGVDPDVVLAVGHRLDLYADDVIGEVGEDG